ncbi:ankyrin repeat-containing domain protein [Xylariomycetidae sp. FL0641]|nr:ankyrin repeat-containing domain protein [Xylariomycetidae sp. FL0641]
MDPSTPRPDALQSVAGDCRLLSCPNEVLIMVTLNLDPASKARLARTCRSLNRLATFELYKAHARSNDCLSLWWACTKGNLGTLYQSINAGVSTHYFFLGTNYRTVEDKHASALTVAVRNAQSAIVYILLTHGAEPNAHDKQPRRRCTPPHHRLWYPLNWALEPLLHLNQVNVVQNRSPIRTIKYLLAFGADTSAAPDVGSSFNNTGHEAEGAPPIHQAVNENVPVEAMSLLLEAGAYHSAINTVKRQYPLDVLLETAPKYSEADFEKMKLLARSGATCSSAALEKTCFFQKKDDAFELLELLAENHCSINFDGYSDIGFILYQTLLNVLSQIQDHRLAVESTWQRDGRWNSPVSEYKASLLKSISQIACSALPHMPKDQLKQYYSDLLECACELGYPMHRFIAKLLEKCRYLHFASPLADIECLGSACRSINPSSTIVKFLLQYIGDIYKDTDRWGYSPLSALMDNSSGLLSERLEIMKLLLNHGASPDLRFHGSGWTLLDDAIFSGSKEVAKLLISKGGVTHRKYDREQTELLRSLGYTQHTDQY